MYFGDQVLQFYNTLEPNWKLPKSFDLIYPFDGQDTKESMSSFYKKYFSDNNERIFLFGINPGRFGAGVTGVPFTCPIHLERECDIPNPFDKKYELSSQFVYLFINAMGGPEEFYKQFYISSICPLGFIKEGRNANYYDDKILTKAVEKHIVSSIESQIAFGANRKVAFSMGMGQNMKYFEKINKEYQFFEEVIALPHPRWVMQYRRKKMDIFVQNYVENLTNHLA